MQQDAKIQYNLLRLRAVLIYWVNAGFVRVFGSWRSAGLLKLGLEVDWGLKEKIDYFC
jgi:hypothetical protein